MHFVVMHPFKHHKLGDILTENPGAEWIDRNFVAPIKAASPKLEKAEHRTVEHLKERTRGAEPSTEE